MGRKSGQARMYRRVFLAGTFCASLIPICAEAAAPAKREALPSPKLGQAERKRAIASAKRWLDAQPKTITDYPAARSPGGQHAYYSEGDYWWPDPVNPGGPYIRRDGLSNPDRFDDHRQALIRFSRIVPSLTAGWVVSGKRSYAKAAKAHLLAWFVNPTTRMAPHLEHAQAIIGVNKGRGTGIIDTLHLVEVAHSIDLLAKAQGLFSTTEITTLRAWFADYLKWLQTSPNGLDEGDEVNNHGTTYVLQVAAFAGPARAPEQLDWCRNRLRQLVEAQVAADGRQPLELARTKPFGYCLFNLDALAACAHLLSTPTNNLWTYKGVKSGSIADALAYMAPFITDKSKWPHAQDVAYWADWPVRHPALLFGGQALNRPDYLALWRKLEPDPEVPEIIRNFPIRQPLLWP